MKCKIIERGSRSVVARGWEWGTQQTENGFKVTFQEEEETILYLGYNGSFKIVYNTKIHQTVDLNGSYYA